MPYNMHEVRFSQVLLINYERNACHGVLVIVCFVGVAEVFGNRLLFLCFWTLI
jgi:hypothetical protein